MHVSRDVDGNPPPSPGVVDLFWAFLTVSCSAFGGALPWAQRMIVRNRRWMRPDEFTDVLALCQFLPGPNVVNVARSPSGSASAVSRARWRPCWASWCCP